jgi:hypothetical protein
MGRISKPLDTHSEESNALPPSSTLLPSLDVLMALQHRQAYRQLDHRPCREPGSLLKRMDEDRAERAALFVSRCQGE